MTSVELSVEQIINAVTSKQGRVNTVALQELLHVIVQKMKISNEKVVVDANMADQFQELIQEPQTNQGQEVGANEEEATCLRSRIGVLENLLNVNHERLQNMQCDIHELHRIQEEAKRVRNHEFLRKIMDECSKCPCDEDAPEIPFCVDYSNPYNELVLGLLSNKTFLVELMKRVSCPILDKVSNWESQLEIMGELFQKFIDKAEEEFSKIPTPEMNEKAIKQLRDDFELFKADFLNVVQEIQDMLDAKLDKLHIPALKKFITDELQILHDEVNMLKKNEDCPDGLATAKAVLENVACLTCAGTVCQRTKPLKMPIFRKSKGDRSLQKDSNIKLPKRTCGGSHTVFKAEQKIFKGVNLADEFGVKVVQPEMVFVQGNDGNMYRAEPELPVCTCKKKEPVCPCPDDEDITPHSENCGEFQYTCCEMRNTTNIFNWKAID